MATSQEIKDAADAVISAKTAYDAAQNSFGAAVGTAVAAAQASPEGVAFLAAAGAYETVLQAEQDNAGVPAAQAALSSASDAYQVAVAALQAAALAYDGL